MTVTFAVASAAGAAADTEKHIESTWPLLDASTEVCGLSKNYQWRPDTGWWNEQGDEAAQDNHARLKIYKGPSNGLPEVLATAAPC